MTKHDCTRREFLAGSVGVTLAAAAAGTLSGTATRTASGMEEAVKKGRPQLSACIEALFRNVPIEQRLQLTKDVGLSAFEFWGVGGKDIDAIKRKKDELGLQAAIFSCNTGGALVAAGSKEKFLAGLRESIAVAQKLDCKRLIATVGNEIKDLSRAEQHKNIVAAVKAGAPILEEASVTLCLEPLNVLVNHKGYYLATSKEGFEIVDEVGSPNVLLLFDIYHQQITEGNLIANITNNIKKIGHFHVADNPGRREPGTGEINYFNVFKAIGKSGYSAFVGLEMWPAGDNVAAVKETKKIFDDALAA